MDDQLTDSETIRDAVGKRYSAAADLAKASPSESGAAAGSCCASPALTDAEAAVFGASQYSESERSEIPEEAALASLGCGNPAELAELHDGETVLDLGSGGGIDVLLSARRVGAGGKAFGVDMTEEMLDLARENQRRAGIENVEWLKGTIEQIPLPDGAVDVVISNCVINLSADKQRVFAEAARVLRPGGRLAITDVVADENMDAATRSDIEQWTGCIAGALTQEQLEATLAEAGLEEIEVRKTHRVHEQAASAFIRARKPSA